MSDNEPMIDKNNYEENQDSDDGKIEVKLEKTKSKKPYVYTEKRKQAYEKMIAKKTEYMQNRQKEKEMKGRVNEPPAKTINKIAKLKKRLEDQGFKMEDEPIPIKSKVHYNSPVEESSEDEELIQIKKKKKKPVRKIYIESSSLSLIHI